VTDDLTAGQTGADVAYRWTVRALYAVAIGLNVWMLWDTVADEADTERFKQTARRWWQTAARPLHLEKIMKKETGPLLWEAERIVEEAKGA
jgi:hypothetical protein